MNNFEKIKAMNIDEMAELFNILKSSCMSCIAVLDKCSSEHYGSKNCLNSIKQWLELESEE